MRKSLISFLFCFLGPKIVLACTDLRATSATNLVLTDVGAPGTISITVQKTGAPCDYFVTLSAGSSGNFDRKLFSGSESIRYNIYRDSSLSQVIKDIPEANANEVISGSFVNTGDETHSYTVLVKAVTNSFQPTGMYHDNINLRIFKSAYSAAAPVARTVNGIHVVYNQPVVQSLSLVDAGGAFQQGDTKQLVSFSPLREGARQTFDLLIRSNSNYLLKVESQNEGKLKHATLDRFVNYVLELGGRPIDLRATSVMGRANSMLDPSAGDRYPMTVKIGATRGALAGRYNDYITFTVEAN